MRVADVEQHPHRRRVEPADKIAHRKRVVADQRRRGDRIDRSEVLDGDREAELFGAECVTP
jgi:hypothetical protein